MDADLAVNLIQTRPVFKVSTLLALTLSTFAFIPTQLVHANPLNPNVTNGQASFNTQGNTLTIKNTPGTIINWQDFSIGANEATRFVQQSASSAVLNRVTGGLPSNIFGVLQSNGQVFLINPTGIVFGAGATIDVSGLVASTLNLSDADFLAGNYNYAAIPGAQNLSNAGSINAQNGGHIFLIAPNVENTGIITAPNGEILLAAGNSVQLVSTTDPNLRVSITAPAGDATNLGKLIASSGSLGLFGSMVKNAGQVSADSVTQQGGKIMFKASQNVTLDTGSVTSALGGSVSIDAGAAVLSFGDIHADAAGSVKVQADRILQTGVITATQGGNINLDAQNGIIQTQSALLDVSNTNGTGGTITVNAGVGRLFSSSVMNAKGANGGMMQLLGQDIYLLDSQLDASGQQGGGTILIGGDAHGGNPAVPNALTTFVNSTSSIKADALTSGNGGKVIVWSDQDTQYFGSLTAKGGAQGGDGGFAEVSGKNTLTFGGLADLSSAKGVSGNLLLDPANITISSVTASPAFQLLDPHPLAGNSFGAYTYVLTNGNVVVAVPVDSLVAASAGAVYLFDGTTGALVSTLTGSAVSDRVGIDGVTALTNGNFVVDSSVWSGGTGAVTWGSGTVGISGAVSSANSLVGGTAADGIGTRSAVSVWDARNNVVNSINGGKGGVIALTNGNYVVSSPYAASNFGLVTWGNGLGGTVGVANSTNSLIGTATGDFIGSNVVALSNGNYVVGSPDYKAGGGLVYVGAVTWGNGLGGTIGAVSAANSLLGSASYDTVGASITALNNGNYVVNSYGWSTGGTNKAGAVTWGNGAGGTVGAVSITNSLVGTIAQNLGWGSNANATDGVTALTNGNYVVMTASSGFTTWGNGLGGTVGNLSVANSLQGTGGTSTIKVTALTNGNYVVANQGWNPGAVTGAGAVTWGNGTTGTVGTVSAVNSLVGSILNDNVGSGGVTALTNGNYVVNSPNWDNGVIANTGAVTWGNGAGGTVGAVSAANSLVGSTANDTIGLGFVGSSIVALSNGNYVVGSKSWDNGAVVDAGAATWGDGATAGVRLVGAITAANSLVGSTTLDYVGSKITPLALNGNYVVSSNWANGAVAGAGAATWGNGLGGTVGTISAVNSLVGSTLNDGVSGNVVALPGGNYLVLSSGWDSAAIANVGAVTWGNGLGGTVGTIGAIGSAGIAASLIGDQANDSLGGWFGSGKDIIILNNGDYVVNDPGWHTNTGYVGMGKANVGLSGVASAANGSVGAVASDYFGYDYAGAGSAGGSGNGVRSLANGAYVISSSYFNGGFTTPFGRVDLINPAAAAGVNSPWLYANYTGQNITVSPASITAITNNGTAVKLQASNDITVNSAIVSAPVNVGGAITMQAGRSILVNANITTGNANLTLIANDTLANGVATTERLPGAAQLVIANGVTLNAGTGLLSMQMLDGAGRTGTQATGGDISITNSILNASTISISNSAIGGGITWMDTGNIAPSGTTTLTTAGGNVLLNSDSDGIAGGAITLNGSSIFSNGGNITLGGGVAGNGSGYAVGSVDATSVTACTPSVCGIALIGAASTLNSGGGNIVLRGTSFAGGAVAVYGGVWAEGTIDGGAGTILIDGISQGGGAANSQGLMLQGTITSANTTANAISLTGSHIGSTTAQSIGIDSAATVQTTAGGGITLMGTGGTTTVAGAAPGLYLVGNVLSNSGAINLTGIAGAGSASTDISFLGGSTIGASFATSIPVSTSNITLNADTLTMTPTDYLQSSGNLLIAPRTAGTTIGIAGGAGTLALTAANFSTNIFGFTNVTVGTASAGAITVGGALQLGTNTAFVSGSGGIAIDAATNATFSVNAYNLDLNTTGVLAINAPVTGANITGLSGTGVTLGAAGVLTSTSVGNGIVLSTGAGNFANNAGATALTVNGGGRWLIYTNDAVLDNNGGLVSMNPDILGKTYAIYAPANVIETGNRYLHTLGQITAPIPVAAPIGNVNIISAIVDAVLLGGTSTTINTQQGLLIAASNGTQSQHSTTPAGMAMPVCN